MSWELRADTGRTSEHNGEIMGGLVVDGEQILTQEEVVTFLPHILGLISPYRLGSALEEFYMRGQMAGTKMGQAIRLDAIYSNAVGIILANFGEESAILAYKMFPEFLELREKQTGNLAEQLFGVNKGED